MPPGNHKVALGVWDAKWFTYLYTYSATFSITAPALVYQKWVVNKNYLAGNIVRYTNGKSYIAVHNNPGYNPTVSTYFWKIYLGN